MQYQKPLTIEELSMKLKPIFGNKIDQLYLKYSVSDSQEEKNEILQILSLLYQRHLVKLLDKEILLEPAEKDFVDGEYLLGDVIYSGKKIHEFGLREEDWPRHVCISGMSGSGKTNFAFNILSDFIKKDKEFLVFDWKKSFRSLINIDPALMVFTIGKDSASNLFKMNINRPPQGVSPREWINVLCDLLTESFCASFGVHKILLETLDEIFEKWGIYAGEKHYPNWMHVKKMLEIKAKEARGREATWFESALRIASVLTFGDFGKVINYDGKKSLSVENLFDNRVIFELNSLSNTEKKFFCEFILTYIYKYKKSNQEKIESKFDYAILVDEAHNVFLKDKTHFVSESVTDMVYREMREYGVSLICLDQHISKLSDTVKGNSACHVAFQQQLPQDIMDISSLMQLTDRKDYFSQLAVGSAIVKLSDRYTKPFLVETPLVDLRNKNISDDRIKERMEFLLKVEDIETNEPEFKQAMQNNKLPEKIKLEFVADSKENYENKLSKEIQEKKNEKPQDKKEILKDFILDKLNSGRTLKEIEHLLENGLSEKLYTFSDILESVNLALKEKLTSTKKSDVSARNKEIALDSLSDEEKQFLSYLKLNPNHKNSTVEVYEKAGFSTRKGNIIKNRLMEKSLIKIEEEKYNKGWKKFIRLS